MEVAVHQAIISARGIVELPATFRTRRWSLQTSTHCRQGVKDGKLGKWLVGCNNNTRLRNGVLASSFYDDTLMRVFGFHIKISAQVPNEVIRAENDRKFDKALQDLKRL
jgi:hypothetical protein